MSLIWRILLLLFSLMVTASCIFSLLPLLPVQDSMLHWLLWIVGQFRFQYLVLQGLALAVIGCYLLKPKVRTLNMALFTVLVTVSFAVNSYFIAPYYRLALKGKENSTQVKPLKIMLSNTGFITDYQALLHYIGTAKPDIICIVELEPKLSQIMHSELMLKLYPFQKKENASQLGLYSKLPILKSSLSPPSLDTGYSLETLLKSNHSEFMLVLSHPVVPYSSQTLKRHEQHFLQWQKHWASSSRPLIIVGDMNATPWSPEFIALLEETRLRDSATGFGIQPSWSANNPFIAVPIDHILLSPQFIVNNREIGPEVGSDHRPVLLTLDLSP